ncbi:MAG: Maf family nucleotide pyrophosphatase [Bacteroidota bacterium]|nr:Maf family nucleotide pyrophosphatase [Bacteroidota bacterium]
MSLDKINRYKILLASNSPRRKDLLSKAGIKTTVITGNKVDESIPAEIQTKEIAQYLAKKKNSAYQNLHKKNTVLITADTVVIKENQVLNKPKNKEEARRMLHNLSGSEHEVHSGVCISTKTRELVFSEISTVFFDKLSETEIEYYIENYKPFDKAGAYGIQEWIGHIGIVKIEGSYDNIVGLPTRAVYRNLIELCR